MSEIHLLTERYEDQVKKWPPQGKHILAQYDEASVVVYQAYRPAIGRFAARRGYFGGGFSLERMSWVKPNFLWMMYRSGWAQKEHQEVVLAVRLKREAFDEILAQAVHSTYKEELYGSPESWKQALETSHVRLQWDPDHDPRGAKLERRAIQLGLRGPVLAQYAREWILDIEDISQFVHEQYHYVESAALDQLMMPAERVYPVVDPQVVVRLEITA